MAEAWWAGDALAPRQPDPGAAPASTAASGNWWAGDALAPQQASTAAQTRSGSGVVANVGAGANEAIAGIAGAPVDAMTWLVNKGAGLVTGNTEPWISHPIGGSESLKSAMGLIGADPRNIAASTTAENVARGVGQGAASMVAPYMGARAAIANGITEGIPGAIARGFGGPAPADAGIARTALGATGNAAVGAGASLGGQGAEALLPEGSPYRPLANFAGQMAGGGLVAGGMAAGKAALNTGAGFARNLVAPFRQDTLETQVGQRLRSAASDPAELARSLDVANPELVPGSLPTTFQLTGDQGIGRLQATLPAAPFEARAAQQGAARAGVLQGLAPEAANPGAVRDLLKQRLAQIDSEGEANIAAARQNAQQALEQAGGKLNREDYGALMRDQLEAAKAATKARESALWRAIDPEGKLTIDAQPVRQAANRIAAEIPATARPPEGEEQAVLGFAQLAGSAMPFTDFAALRSRLLQVIRDERANGQTPALRRMQMLRASMDDTIGALSAKAAENDPALFARLTQQAGDFYGGPGASAATTAAGGYGGGGAAAIPGGGSQAAAGVPGTAGHQGGGLGGTAGYQGIPEPRRPQDIVQFLLDRGGLLDQGGELRSMDLNRPNKGYFGILSRGNGMPLDTPREIAVEEGYLHPDSDVSDLLSAIDRNMHGQPVFSDRDASEAADWLAYDAARRSGEFEPMPPLPGAPANWDAAAAARYRAAADATRNRAQTFNNPQIGPALAERGGMYRMAESRIPERFLSSPEGVQAFFSAGGDPATLKDALVADLRSFATNPDGALSPVKLASWQLKRNAALRAFPDLQQTLGTVANAQQAVDVAAATVRAQTLSLQRGAARYFLNAEPTQAVRSALNGRNPMADMGELSRLVASDPDAKAGLQRAVADYISQRFVTGDAEQAGIGAAKAQGFNDFVRRNLALRQVFSPEQMQAMHSLAADLQRSSQALPNGAAAPPVSAASKLSLLSGYLGHGIAGLSGYLLGGLRGAIEGSGGYAMAKSAIDAIRRAGVERTDQLLTEALLNPELARTLLMKATPGNRQFIAQRLSQQLGTLATVSGAEAASGRERAVPVRANAPARPMVLPALPAPVLRPGGALMQRGVP